MPSFASAEIEAAWAQIEGTLDHLVGLVQGLDERALNWRPPVREGAGEASNSLYVIATHALGVAEEAMLFMLAGESGTRDRAAEFAAAGPTPEAIEERWAALRERIPTALAKLDASALDGAYEHSRRGAMPGREVLHGTATHVAIHAGHADITRDLLPAG
jgi:hypothetical protein